MMKGRSIFKLLKLACFVIAHCIIILTLMPRIFHVRKSRCQSEGFTDTPVFNESMKRKLESSHHTQTETMLPLIYVVTPTWRRLTQKVDLTRMSHTLMLVPRLHWVLVEDSANRSSMVAELLKRSGLPHTHLNVSMPEELAHISRTSKPRGLLQRNIGLQWLREYGRPQAVVYFANDDNVYDIRLFEEMRYTMRVSVWPTAFVAKQRYESPLVTNGKMRYTMQVSIWPTAFVAKQRYESPLVTNGKVTGWLSVLPRRFCTDMAGFAINLQLFLDYRNVTFRPKRGYMETDLLEQLKLDITDLEPKADNCTKGCDSFLANMIWKGIPNQTIEKLSVLSIRRRCNTTVS